MLKAKCHLYSGINVGKVIICTMGLYGAFCGLTSFLIVVERDRTISTVLQPASA